MNRIVEPRWPNKQEPNRNPREVCGFTLTEALVLMVVIFVLASLILPVSINRHRVVRRIGCLNNLTQIGIGTFAYAEDFSGYLPPWRAGHPWQDDMSAERFSRYVWTGWTPGWKIAQTFNQSTNGQFHNAGFLYGMKYAGEGQIFWCPMMHEGPYSPIAYMPLISSDGKAEDGYNGSVRSSYYFNPRMRNADPAKGPVNPIRRFQKAGQLQGHKVFGSDAIAANSHRKEKGFYVLYTDGSASFNKNKDVWARVVEGRWLTSRDREAIYDLWER